MSLVLGNCVFHVGHRSGFQATERLFRYRGEELPKVTQALYEARERAMTRMQDEAANVGGQGTVGVQLEEKSHMMGSHVIEFLAVRDCRATYSPPRPLASPQMILSLDH